MRYLITIFTALFVFAGSCAAQEPFDPGPEKPTPAPVIVLPDPEIAIYTKRSSEIAPEVVITTPPRRIVSCGDQTISADITTSVGVQRVDINVISTLNNTVQRYYLFSPPWTVNWVMPCNFSLPGGSLNHTYRIKVIAWDTGEDQTVSWQYSITGP